jgi:hypothetical protein
MYHDRRADPSDVTLLPPRNWAKEATRDPEPSPRTILFVVVLLVIAGTASYTLVRSTTALKPSKVVLNTGRTFEATKLHTERGNLRRFDTAITTSGRLAPR